MNLLSFISFPGHHFLTQVQTSIIPRVDEKLAVTRFPSNGDELVTYHLKVRSVTHTVELGVQAKTNVYVEFLDGFYVPEEWT